MEILLKIWRFPLRFDAFGGFWVDISIKNLEIPLRFDAFGCVFSLCVCFAG